MDNPRVDKEMILEAVSGIRERFETKSIPLDELERLYFRYNPSVEDTRSFVRYALTMFPDLNCGLTSIYLADRLGLGHPVVGSYGKHAHTFLLLDDHTIIDITADQYGGPPVYVGPLQPPWAI